jgi:hypothetical protein
VKVGDVRCGREVRMELVRARDGRKSVAQLLGVHWRRTLVGVLKSLVAGMLVVPDQEGNNCPYLRTKQISSPRTDRS